MTNVSGIFKMTPGCGQILSDPLLGSIDYCDSTICTSHNLARTLISILTEQFPDLFIGKVDSRLKQTIQQIGGVVHTIEIVMDQQRHLKVLLGQPVLLAIKSICQDLPIWDSRIFIKTIMVDSLDSPETKRMVELVTGIEQGNLKNKELASDNPTENTLVTSDNDANNSPESKSDTDSVLSSDFTDTSPSSEIGGVPISKPNYTVTQNEQDSLETVIGSVVSCLAKHFPKALSDDTTKNRCFVPRVHTKTLTERLLLGFQEKEVTSCQGDQLVSKILELNVEYSNKNVPELFQRTTKRYHNKTRTKDRKLLGTIRKNGSWYLSSVYQPKKEGEEYRFFDDAWIGGVVDSL